jgi:hypothetical protein
MNSLRSFPCLFVCFFFFLETQVEEHFNYSVWLATALPTLLPTTGTAERQAGGEEDSQFNLLKALYITT